MGVGFRGHKRGHNQEGNVIVRLLDEVQGMGSSLDKKGGAVVALMVDLLSCHPALPSGAPSAPYRTDGKIEVALSGYWKALRALRETAVLSAGRGSH